LPPRERYLLGYPDGGGTVRNGDLMKTCVQANSELVHLCEKGFDFYGSRQKLIQAATAHLFSKFSLNMRI
jgi:hypothetical protein